MSDGLLNASVISLQNSQNILSVIRLHIGHPLNIFFVSPEPFSSVPLQGLWRNKKLSADGDAYRLDLWIAFVMDQLFLNTSYHGNRFLSNRKMLITFFSFYWLT